MVKSLKCCELCISDTSLDICYLIAESFSIKSLITKASGAVALRLCMSSNITYEQYEKTTNSVQELNNHI